MKTRSPTRAWRGTSLKALSLPEIWEELILLLLVLLFVDLCVPLFGCLESTCVIELVKSSLFSCVS